MSLGMLKIILIYSFLFNPLKLTPNLLYLVKYVRNYYCTCTKQILLQEIEQSIPAHAQKYFHEHNKIKKYHVSL